METDKKEASADNALLGLFIMENAGNKGFLMDIKEEKSLVFYT